MASLSNLLETPLNASHRQLGARMVDFAGWDMPVQYPSGIIAEHLAVRERCGIFDLSHMGRVYVRGRDALALAQTCCTRDLSRIPAGAAAYSVLCAEDGGIVDDVIAYVLGAAEVLFVFNASNRLVDIDFFNAQAVGLDVTLDDATFDTALIGVQGPNAQALLQPLTATSLDSLAGYAFTRGKTAGCDALIARTGYTGEDGFELMIAAADSPRLWSALVDAQATPCGLGARDTLRTEAGFALYGHEIDRTTNPFEARLGWVVNLNKTQFVGRDALAQLKADGPKRRLVGLRVGTGPVPRPGAPILPEGSVTSGTFSPSLRANIAMGYIPIGLTEQIRVEVRGKPLDAELASLPFVPHRSRPRSTMKP